VFDFAEGTDQIVNDVAANTDDALKDLTTGADGEFKDFAEGTDQIVNDVAANTDDALKDFTAGAADNQDINDFTGGIPGGRRLDHEMMFISSLAPE
jgi:soluble cytochrome b562